MNVESLRDKYYQIRGYYVAETPYNIEAKRFELKKPLNWDSEIRKAEKKGKFTLRAKAGANSWATCSVGELVAKRFNTLFGDNPTDKILDYLGMQFLHNVRDDNIEGAKSCRNVIKQRMSMLVDEQV